MPRSSRASSKAICPQCRAKKAHHDQYCFKCGLQHGGDTDDDDDHPPRSGGAGPAVATGTTVGQPKIAFQGWLKKRGKRNKRSWRVRWFVLYSGAPAGVLSYYTDKDCKRKKGSITLEEAFVYQVDPTEDGQAFGFNIVTGIRLWEIFAGKEAYRKQWLDVLEKATVSRSSALIDEAEAMMEAHLSRQAELPESTLFSSWRKSVDSGPITIRTPSTSGADRTTSATRSGGSETEATEGVFSMNFGVHDSESNTDESSEDDNFPVAPTVTGWRSERGAPIATHGTRNPSGSVSTRQRRDTNSDGAHHTTNPTPNHNRRGSNSMDQPRSGTQAGNGSKKSLDAASPQQNSQNAPHKAHVPSERSRISSQSPPKEKSGLGHSGARHGTSPTSSKDRQRPLGFTDAPRQGSLCTEY
eukprot:m.268036 g.268036  ORF g.268036 m.268036 type:complete len:412 (+) comp16049_c0_seq4:348-1583(+)